MKRKFSGAIFRNRRFKRTTLSIALAATFSALVLVATMLIAIPVPATGGYVNVGDTLIFTAGILFGPFVGGVAGGLGSMLSDLILGYGFYAPFTLLIKGLEGVLCGFIGIVVHKKIKNNALSIALQVAAMVLSGLFMVAGYFIVEWAAFGVGAAVAAIVGNIIQAFASVALASALLFFCKLGKKVVVKGMQTMPQKRPNNTPPSTKPTEESDTNPLEVSDTATATPTEGTDVAQSLQQTDETLPTE